MEVTLIHNPKAGSGSLAKKDLIREFKRAGHDVEYQSTKSDKFPRALEKPGDVVVIAGGDGTVRKVARRLIGHNVPIAILPLGTANNVAKALGLARTPRRLVHDLSRSHPVRFDVGVARGPWGDVLFLEGAGLGLFPRMMTDLQADREDGVVEAVDAEGGVDGALRFLRRVLDTFRGRECTVKIDGQTHSGTYLLVEALNIPSIGPAVELAPKADPGDGLLNIVLIKESHRAELRRHLVARFEKRHPATFPVHRARNLQLSCPAKDIHFDDEWWPVSKGKKVKDLPPSSGNVTVEIGVFPGALRVLVP